MFLPVLLPKVQLRENRAKLKNPMILILQIKHLSTVLISVVIFLKRIEFREQVWVLATIWFIWRHVLMLMVIWLLTYPWMMQPLQGQQRMLLLIMDATEYSNWMVPARWTPATVCCIHRTEHSRNSHSVLIYMSASGWTELACLKR